MAEGPIIGRGARDKHLFLDCSIPFHLHQPDRTIELLLRITLKRDAYIYCMLVGIHSFNTSIRHLKLLWKDCFFY